MLKNPGSASETIKIDSDTFDTYNSEGFHVSSAANFVGVTINDFNLRKETRTRTFLIKQYGA